MSVKFLKCSVCGNLVEVINESGVPMICCGKPMEEIPANTVDASQEKHVPVVTIVGDEVTVNVGSVEHPMIPEHSILWVCLEGKETVQKKYLTPDMKPEAKFKLSGDVPVAAYAYCNLHGLWKTEL